MYHHADKLVQAVVGSDVDLWGSFEKVTQASATFIRLMAGTAFNA
jgi:hypothetical protein